MTKSKYVKFKADFAGTDLNLKETAVLSYLSSLTKKDYCFASNQHISETLKINERTLYRVLSSLERKGLIIRETESIGKMGRKRKIFVSPSVKTAYHNI